MTALTIRNLSTDVVRRLRVRAAEHGRSMEAELREVLQALAEGRVDIRQNTRPSDVERREAEMDARIERVQAKVRRMFGGELPAGRVDAFLCDRHAAAERGE